MNIEIPDVPTRRLWGESETGFDQRSQEVIKERENIINNLYWGMWRSRIGRNPGKSIVMAVAAAIYLLLFLSAPVFIQTTGFAIVGLSIISAIAYGVIRLRSALEKWGKNSETNSNNK